MKVIYICICKAIFGFKEMVLFLIFQVMGGLRVCAILFSESGFIPYQRPGYLCLLLFFVGITFHTKKSTAHSLFATESYKRSPTPIPPLSHLLSQFQRG